MGAEEKPVTHDHRIARVADLQAALATGELLERHRATAKRSELLHSLPYLILKDADGKERVEYLPEQVECPTFRKGVVKLLDGPSFIAYVNEHKTANSAIYAALDPCKFVAVLDEHADNQAGDPSWRDFRAEFTPTLSKEWLTWMEHNGSKRAFESNEEFAFFIEDNAPDFTDPSAGAMMEMALNFKVTQAVKFSAAQRLQDGKVDFQYQNEVEGRVVGGSAKIPETFTIEIPIFSGLAEPTQTIKARFRFRLTNGSLRIWYELERPHKVLEASFKKLYADIHDGAGEVSMHLGISD